MWELTHADYSPLEVARGMYNDPNACLAHEDTEAETGAEGGTLSPQKDLLCLQK